MNKMGNDIAKSLYSRKVIDNRELSMLDAIKFLLSEENTKSLDMAVGYFYISGMLLLKDEFIDFMDKRNGKIRILMGNQTDKQTVTSLDKDSTQEDLVKNGLNYYKHLVQQSDSDVSKIDDIEFLTRVKEWLDQKRIEVKVYVGEANYFHAKSYLFASSQEAVNGTAIVGSSNFSRNGLQGNTELNVLSQDSYYPLHEWYSNLWLSDDETAVFSPELIKLVTNKLPIVERVMNFQPVKKTYYDFAGIYAKPYTNLNIETTPWAVNLYPHQQSGVVAIKHKLDTFGTAILADGVGLGKTRTTAGIIKLYLQIENVNKVLIVADKKLKVQWQEELAILGIHNNSYDYTSREKFIRLSNSEIKKLKYTLVVIDEAHMGFKNNNTRAYQKMMILKKANPDLKGLLLTATPWNNKREDVINIGTLFLDIDAIPNDRNYKQYLLLAGKTNKAVRGIAGDDVAFNQLWADLFLQRTRKTYGGKNVKFPNRKFPTVDIRYEPRKDQIFSDNFDTIVDLSFPYMDPIKYVIDSKREDVGGKKLKLMLLKRADSSWVAYKKSLESIIDRLNLLNDNLNKMGISGNIKGDFKAFLGDYYGLSDYAVNLNLAIFDVKKLQKIDDEDEDEEIANSRRRKQVYLENITDIINKISTRKAESAVEKMKVAANRDLSTLNALLAKLNKAYEKHDEKIEEVSRLVQEELSKKHKVILVSQFIDTVSYYYDELYTRLNDKNNPVRMGMVTGGANNGANSGNKINQISGVSKKEVLDRFSPQSKNRMDLFNTDEEINVLVGTDAISTGQNLQDAVTLMNLDLPYNPMQLEQRIGRIDRPRKQNDDRDIYIYTFPVYTAIDSQLKMTERLGTKMKGAIDDTEFDNVVLPEYIEYLKNAKKKDLQAVETMLDTTLDKITYNSGMNAEEHTDQYEKANKRMYDFRTNGTVVSKSIKLENVSFSDGKSNSIAVIKVTYRDVNDEFLSKEEFIINLDDKKVTTVTDGENSLYNEITHDYELNHKLLLSDAKEIVNKKKSILEEVVKNLVDKYNNQLGSLEKNVDNLQDKIAKGAANKLMDSAKDINNRDKIISILNKANIDPSKLGLIINYIETITPEDEELYAIVKEINQSVDNFWFQLDSGNLKYRELFDPNKLFNSDTVEFAETLNAARKDLNTRQADIKNTTFEVILENINLSK